MTDLSSLLDQITHAYPSYPPQLRTAAKHVLDRPQDVALKSMRGLAADAVVPPSTMVRLAKAAGFEGYEAFREVFQEAIRTSGTDFASQAAWLQQLPEGGRAAKVLAGMAEAVLRNSEDAFRRNSPETLAEAATLLRRGRRVHVVGVGGMHALAVYFHYVARMALADVRLVAPAMGTMIDELGDLGPDDAVLILSVAPYATESVRAAEFARRKGARLIALTDSRAAPIASSSTVLLLVATATPQFFPSQSATIALLETLIALIVSHGDKRVLNRIAQADRLRREEGIYWLGKR